MNSHQIITPISEQQQAEVVAATNHCIARASRLYGQTFEAVPIDFDLSGRCAGMYQVRGSMRRIRFNPWLFAKYYQDSIGDTVIHEVAHYDLTGIPTRQYQRFAYNCGCRTHQLAIIRHRKIMKQRAKYLCQFCHCPLIAVPQETT